MIKLGTMSWVIAALAACLPVLAEASGPSSHCLNLYDPTSLEQLEGIRITRSGSAVYSWFGEYGFSAASGNCQKPSRCWLNVGGRDFWVSSADVLLVSTGTGGTGMTTVVVAEIDGTEKVIVYNVDELDAFQPVEAVTIKSTTSQSVFDDACKTQ